MLGEHLIKYNTKEEFHEKVKQIEIEKDIKKYKL